MANFVIRRPSAREPRSLIIPEAMVKGLAVMVKHGAPTYGDQSNGTEFHGFLTQAVVSGGNASQLKQDAWLPGANLEYNLDLNAAVTIVDADVVDAEGTDLILASGGGTEATGISAATPEGWSVSFTDGKFSIATTGQKVFFTLGANLTAETDGNVRRRFIRV